MALFSHSGTNSDPKTRIPIVSGSFLSVGITVAIESRETEKQRGVASQKSEPGLVHLVLTCFRSL